jgi:hypothetical protein
MSVSGIQFANKFNPFIRIGKLQRFAGLPVVGLGEVIVFIVPNGVDGKVFAIVQRFALASCCFNEES